MYILLCIMYIHVHEFILMYVPGTYISSGGRLVQTFSKVCMSLQSLRLGDFLQTFCRLFLWINYSHEHFLHTFCTLSVANDYSSADFMHTFSVFCRSDADLMQTKSVWIAESLHTTCTPIMYFSDLMQT